MTKEHFETAKASLLIKGDTICEFMAAENQHVIASKHRGGIAFTMGRAVHQVIAATDSICSSKQ